MDSLREHHTPEAAIDDPPMPTLAELEAFLAESDADVAAGDTVPLAPVLAEMRATAERIRCERSAKEKRAAHAGT